MVHKRSKEAHARRKARRQAWHEAKTFIRTSAYWDFVQAETVCRTNDTEVVNFVLVLHPNMTPTEAKYSVPHIEQGIVLSDSRGRGVFQTGKLEVAGKEGG